MNLAQHIQLKRHVSTLSRKGRAYFENDLSVLNPTIWANEAILQLTPNMVVSNMIARDWDSKVARFGDIVNAFIPGTFVMNRKGALCENVVIQDASGASLQVSLNQWPQVAFEICDGEEDRNALDLVQTLLVPAIQALAQGIDRIVGSQVYQFTDQWAGHLNELDENNFKQYVLEAREQMNRENVPVANRAMILTPGTETEGLSLDSIMTADKVGDNGTALENALLGKKYGWLFAMSQTQPEILANQTMLDTVTVNNAGGYAKGATEIEFDGAGAGDVLAGQWVSIAGDDSVQHIVAVDGYGTGLTISPGLHHSVANDAVMRIIAPGAVNNSGGYAGSTVNPRVIGYAKEILVDGFADSAPQIGQLVSFGEQTEKYAIIQLRIIDNDAGEFGIVLDRPLETAIANDDAVNLGPSGKYNFGFNRNAFTLVNRPLAAPRAGTGAVARVVNDPINRISLRVTISYDPVKQGHLVVIDTLVGVGQVYQKSGVVMGG